MQNYKKLQEFNLKEVAAKTQIELQFLEALVEKDFASLNRFNVRGFIKILSREYELDFSDFYEEFENYLNENNLNIQKKTNMPISQVDYSTKKSFSFFLLFIVILGIFVVVLYYFDTIKTFFKHEQNISSPSVTEILGQAQLNLQNLSSSVVIVDNNQNKTNESIFNDTNLTYKQDQEVQTSQQASSSFQDQNTTNEPTDEILSESLQDSINTNSKIAQFKTNTPVWIGLIDLKSYRKTSLVKKDDFNLSLEKDQLVLTGAAALNVLNERGQEQQFAAGNSKRFLIKDGTIISISLSEFMKLNKGREW
ncbi:hypothetical protein OQH60_01680 [Campylobacter sp. MIT 21-1685]|uniref:hypothetical protein n=1 Tax=unclassified Campylobacter TaxID=2593542 RepID=UPI00224B205B|nr:MULTISPECIES: hypothetical protein [unclassified Campylobacter]MCX2682719.1 hypothetical protein [Campylobacter sp. MIT 21-1684]MCX2751001.1 hypothetical protein [Campylobacter sp. MIT 21-1682]MCX2807068.1 hypothetical protein [Campylobacter sp. MIT 21-1685]